MNQDYIPDEDDNKWWYLVDHEEEDTDNYLITINKKKWRYDADNSKWTLPKDVTVLDLLLFIKRLSRAKQDDIITNEEFEGIFPILTKLIRSFKKL